MPHIQGQRKCADAELAAFAGGLPWPRQLGRRLWHQLQEAERSNAAARE